MHLYLFWITFFMRKKKLSASFKILSLVRGKLLLNTFSYILQDPSNIADYMELIHKNDSIRDAAKVIHQGDICAGKENVSQRAVIRVGKDSLKLFSARIAAKFING